MIFIFQQSACASRSIGAAAPNDANVAASNKTLTKITTKRKISEPFTKKTPSHSNATTNNIIIPTKDCNLRSVAVENSCQSEKHFQHTSAPTTAEEKSCQRLSPPSATSTTTKVTSPSSTSILPTSSSTQTFKETLVSRSSTPLNSTIKTENELPGALVWPFEEIDKTALLEQQQRDEQAYESVSSDSSGPDYSSDEEDDETKTNTLSNANNLNERSLGKNFTAQTVSFSATHTSVDDKKLMPPPPKLPTQLKKNGGQGKNGGQSIDFKKLSN